MRVVLLIQSFDMAMFSATVRMDPNISFSLTLPHLTAPSLIQTSMANDSTSSLPQFNSYQPTLPPPPSSDFLSLPPLLLRSKPQPARAHRQVPDCTKRQCSAVKFKCVNLPSNQSDGSHAALPIRYAADSDRFVPWVHAYSMAIHHQNKQMRHTRLKRLKNAGGIWDWKGLGNAYASTTATIGKHSLKRFDSYGNFINFKSDVLNAFEQLMQVGELWQPGQSLLDIGAGPGWIAAYLMAKYGTRVVAYHAPFSSGCDAFPLSPFGVNFFQEEVSEPDMSFTAVSFMNVLHHAAQQTPSLLEQASRIAQRWILITEDIDLGFNRQSLKEHDPKGIFRSRADWALLFKKHCRGFSLRRQGPLLKKISAAPLVEYLGVSDTINWLIAYFVLEREQPTALQSTGLTEPSADPSTSVPLTISVQVAGVTLTKAGEQLLSKVPGDSYLAASARMPGSDDQIRSEPAVKVSRSAEVVLFHHTWELDFASPIVQAIVASLESNDEVRSEVLLTLESIGTHNNTKMGTTRYSLTKLLQDEEGSKNMPIVLLVLDDHEIEMATLE
eukprot:CAMPEP_0119325024 /NCGR_PEP_ID=MMETSP1333-20130426/64787_1 /TAXON_ID=418940 /ORGANISM="Scyphosphaera apsteinii, Strain RCC1455" /LENGTH=554 /DNA_ID=CAMNT_0007332885 /DNA_START=150 /DNA_END=1811 /DNA_ORIENTATION=-